MESEADRFAAEFLMPEREISAALNGLRMHMLAPLKTHWKVSMAAIIRRAADLAKISDRQYRRMLVEMAQMGWKTNEPVEIPAENPTTFRKMHDVHFHDLGLTVAEIARISNTCENRIAAFMQVNSNQGLRVVG